MLARILSALRRHNGSRSSGFDGYYGGVYNLSARDGLGAPNRRLARRDYLDLHRKR